MKKSHLIEIALNILFWIVCGYLIFSIISPKNQEIEYIDGQEIVTITYDNTSIFLITIGFVLKICLYYLNVYVFSKYFNNKQFKHYFLLLLDATVLAIGIEIFKNWLVFKNDFYLFETFIVTLWFYIFFVGVSFVHIMILRWQKEERLKQKLKEDKLTAELQLLKSQIHPHFLFNALNNLLSISEKHQQTEISSGIAQLSELLRFLLHDTSGKTIALSKEIEFIENFIELNKLRFDESDPIDISLESSGQFDEIRIAPALLIPFVENAFKHGIDIYNRSFINITIKANQEQVYFECSNSLHPTKQTTQLESNNSGIGLQNVKRRLSILYPNTHDLNIFDEDNVHYVQLKLNHSA